MTFSRTSVLALLLALVMVLTSQAMAVARSAAGPSGLIELCTGTGPIMVAVDANGQPVGHPHICPDFAAHAFDVGAGMAPCAPVRQIARALRFDTLPVTALSRIAPAPQARGPPFTV